MAHQAVPKAGLLQGDSLRNRKRERDRVRKEFSVRKDCVCGFTKHIHIHMKLSIKYISNCAQPFNPNAKLCGRPEIPFATVLCGILRCSRRVKAGDGVCATTVNRMHICTHLYVCNTDDEYTTTNYRNGQRLSVSAHRRLCMCGARIYQYKHALFGVRVCMLCSMLDAGKLCVRACECVY